MPDQFTRATVTSDVKWKEQASKMGGYSVGEDRSFELACQRQCELHEEKEKGSTQHLKTDRYNRHWLARGEVKGTAAHQAEQCG
jgi:hypothetical protein